MPGVSAIGARYYSPSRKSYETTSLGSISSWTRLPALVFCASWLIKILAWRFLHNPAAKGTVFVRKRTISQCGKSI